MPLFDRLRVVLLVLADGDHLRRAGLAAAAVGCAGEHARRGAFLRHAVERLVDEGHVLGFERQRLEGTARHAAQAAGLEVLDLAHDARAEALSAGGHAGGGLGELKHRERVVALADAQRDGLAGVPLRCSLTR